MSSPRIDVHAFQYASSPQIEEGMHKKSRAYDSVFKCMRTNPLIIVYDKGGTVEVYGECFKLIGLFCLLLLHVSIIF